MTNNLERRLFEHRSGEIEGFTKRYNCKKLVYYEETNLVDVAMDREKELKGWKRDRKDALIEVDNPGWIELAPEIAG